MKRIVEVICIITYSSLTVLDFVTSEDIFEDVGFRFYHGVTPSTYTDFKLNETTNLLNHPSFYLNQSTIIYIHGWNQKLNEADTMLVIVESYLYRKNHNILVLNYENLSLRFYTVVVENTKELGKRVAEALKNLYYGGLNPDQIHLMGFSLGAHICGEVGRALQNQFFIPRITGFDPAYPMYYGTSKYIELNRDDALFVDIIHTDMGILGGPRSSGSADFYPNRGTRPQPRCGNPFWQFVSLAVGDHCAHDASVYYYAESVVADTPKFTATNKLNPYITAQMGYNCKNTAFGDYVLKTD